MKFLTFLTLIVGYFIYLTYKPYLLDIAIASLMAIAFGKVDYLISKKIKNRYLSSGIITFIFAFLMFGPIFYFLFTAGKFISQIDINEIIKVINDAQKLLNYLPQNIAIKVKEFMTPDNISEIYNAIAPLIGSITTKSAIFLKDAFLIVVFFFFAILYGRDILMFLKSIIPLKNNQIEKLFFGTSEVMSVVFYSTIIVSLLEGALFGIIVSIYGLDFFFFSVMYAFASLIPIVGGVLMWGPISLYLYSIGEINGAIVVAIYSIVVISIIADTFIKPIIIDRVKKFFGAETELNSLLIFFAIVAGLSSFGLWGIIIGPAVTALFVSLLTFYKKF